MSIVSKAKEVSFSPATQENVAVSLGVSIGPKLSSELDVLSKAKQDWEGGPFKVMFKLIATMTDEQRDALPDTKADTGNNPRYFKLKVDTTDGKSKFKEVDFYQIVVDAFPAIVAKRQRIELLGRSMKDATKYNLSDIPQDIKDMKHPNRWAEITRLQGECSNAKAATIKAFELFHQFRRFETLPGVHTSLIWAVKDGKEMVDVEVENTKTPIIIRTKLESRKEMDWTRVGVGTFLKFDVDKAMEQGGGYDALLATIKKGTKEKDKDAVSNARLIRTPDTASQAMTDLADYMVHCQEDRTKAAWETFTKSLHGPGSDDAFYNASLLLQSLEMAVGNPKDKVRFQALFTERDKQNAA